MMASCQRNAAANLFLALSGLTFVIATLLVPLRAYIRLRIIKNFWWDDACLILSYIILVPMFAILWRTVTLGLGRHSECYSFAAAVRFLELEFIAAVLGTFSTIFARISVALLVVRLFAVTPGVKRFLYTYTTFMVISLAVTESLVFAQCTPAKAFWNSRLLPTAKCWSPKARDFIIYYNGSISILSDFLLALLPAYFLYRLQMRYRLKVALASLMALGLVPAVCAICRTALSETQIAGDELYSAAIWIMFGSLESSLLIIAATIPALRPLSQAKRKGWFSWSLQNLTPTSAKHLPDYHNATQATPPLAQAHLKTPSRYPIESTHTTTPTERYQGAHDDDTFFMLRGSNYMRADIDAD